MFVNMSNNSLTNVVVAYQTAVASTVSRNKSIVLKINPINTIKIQKYYIYLLQTNHHHHLFHLKVTRHGRITYLYPMNRPTTM